MNQYYDILIRIHGSPPLLTDGITLDQTRFGESNNNSIAFVLSEAIRREYFPYLLKQCTELNIIPSKTSQPPALCLFSIHINKCLKQKFLY